MEKLLIIGAGVEQVPAIIIAKELGYSVVSTDMSLDAPGIKHADKAYKISTTDKKGNIEVGKKEKIDGVLTICSETAVPTVAAVASELNLPAFSESTAKAATDKSVMRQILSGKEIKVSPYIIAEKINEVKSFLNIYRGPWVIKPVDSSGQRGTAIFKDPLLINDLFDNAIKYSKTGKVLVDQFIDGPEVHVTMQVINGAVHFLALSDRITLDKTNFGIAVRHLGPSEIDDRTNEAIKSMCRQSIEAIGLKNGVVTCEVILQQEQPILMEIAIRVPGGYLRDVAMHLSGIDLIKSTIWYSTGDYKPLEALKTEMVYPAVSVKFITSLNIDGSIDKISTIDGLEEAQKIPGVQLINFHFDKEFSVPALNTSVGRFGVIVSTGHSRNDALNATEKAFNTLRINNSYLKEYPNYNPFNKDFK